MQTARVLASALAVIALLAVSIPASVAQSSRDTERKLDRIKRELKDVAAERRAIEGRRSHASRELRDADEQLGHSSRALSETRQQLAQQEATLAALQQRRASMETALAAQRRELATLLRAAYAVGDAAPLKLMLAQDRVADANRLLTLHRYLQRDRAQRISALTARLHELETVEQQIAQARSRLDAEQVAQRGQLAQLERDRKARAQVVAQLDARYRDRAQREKALGRDAKGLERLLAQLRAAAAREAQRKAAAARDAASTGTGTRPRPPVIANARPLQVGGLGWPVSGALLAGFGGTLPDGGTSQGVLIAAPTGTTVRAVADGRVVFSDWMNGYGLILIVDHGNGTMSLYAHNEALLRDTGDNVRRGDPVASVGNSGAPGVPALYFELRREGRPTDPIGWLHKR